MGSFLNKFHSISARNLPCKSPKISIQPNQEKKYIISNTEPPTGFTALLPTEILTEILFLVPFGIVPDKGYLIWLSILLTCKQWREIFKQNKKYAKVQSWIPCEKKNDITTLVTSLVVFRSYIPSLSFPLDETNWSVETFVASGTSEPESIFFFACRNGLDAVISKLIKKMPHYDSDYGVYPFLFIFRGLEIALQSGQTSVAKILLNYNKANLTKLWIHAIVFSKAKNHNEFLRYSMENIKWPTSESGLEEIAETIVKYIFHKNINLEQLQSLVFLGFPHAILDCIPNNTPTFTSFGFYFRV